MGVRWMRMGLAWFFAAASACAGAARAATAVDDDVAGETRALLGQLVADDGPGAAVLIQRGDRPIVRAARGAAQLELGVPLSPDHVFAIASITKVFTAALVVSLERQGRLRLDDPLARHLPDFPNGDRITLRQLLAHTSGVSDVVANPQPGFSRRDLDTTTLLAQIAARPLDFEPGSRFRYSNAGYIVLGAAIERVTGTTWHDAMATQLLRPLGLVRTRYGATTALVPGRVAGYSTDRAGGTVANARYINLSVTGAAGALLSTPDELARALRALARGTAIGPEGFRAMRTPPPHALPGEAGATRYGLGVYLWRVRNRDMIGHTGQVDGFAGAVGYLPGEDLTIVVLANHDTFDARTALRRFAAIALGEPYPLVSGGSANHPAQADIAGTWHGANGTTRTFAVIDGRLQLAREGRAPLALQWSPSGALHFVPDELSYFVPVRDEAGAVVRIDYLENGEGPPVAFVREGDPERPTRSDARDPGHPPSG